MFDTSVMNADVAVLRWPEDAGERRHARSIGKPCLLLVEPGTLPPSDLAADEDWARTTADPFEIHFRTTRLTLLQRSPHDRPTIDEHNLLHYRGSWVALGPLEAQLARLLVEEFGEIVAKERLQQAGADDGHAKTSTLNVRLLRLRRHIADLGLTVTTVRGRGSVMRAGSS
ncbi:MAG: winged helix-turn-helix domain-containing protein [Acidimicrobiia bacterium]